MNDRLALVLLSSVLFVGVCLWIEAPRIAEWYMAKNGFWPTLGGVTAYTVTMAGAAWWIIKINSRN